MKSKVRVVSTISVAMLLASCSQISSLTALSSSQLQNVANNNSTNPRYPESALIYNVCHERWLRNGYTNYTFNIEEGTYVPSSEVQRGKFTQTVVANRKVSTSAVCELSYHPKGASCEQSTRKRLTQGRTIDGLFAKWEKNPTLYQSCHPVLGYPTGYGHTYGVGERRIDASKWFLVSSVIARKSSHVATAPIVKQRVASPVRTKPLSKPNSSLAKKESSRNIGNTKRTTGKKIADSFASVSDLEIKLLSFKVKKVAKSSSLFSQFNVTNETDLPALLGIKGWILDNNYKRYPLSIDGKKMKKGEDSQIVTLEVGAHTQMTVSYEADGVSGISVGKQTVGMLEIMSVDGVKVNLTLPNSSE